MELQIRFVGLPSSDFLHEHIQRRVVANLDRFENEIVSVTVRISDLNGPKGGVDKRCHVLVHTRQVGAVNVEELSEDAYSAVDSAVIRAAHTLARQLERARSFVPAN